MPSCTYIQFAQTQVWPVTLNLAVIAQETATSRSASSKTMNGVFPPSSRLSFFNVDPDCSAKTLPTRVEPVNEIFLTIGDLHRASPRAGALSRAVTMLITPGGTPARSASTARAFSRQWCHSIRLYDNSTARGKSWCCFPSDHAQRKVPRCDETTNTYRFLGDLCTAC